jgi:hypothetical protein
MRCLSFLVWLASCLAISSGKMTPHGSLHTHPRPYNMSTTDIRKGRNRHNQAEMGPSGLTQGLATPSLKGIGPKRECKFTPRARILWTQVSTSASAKSGQLGPAYLHIVTSHHRSSWMWQPMNVRRRSAPVNPSWSKPCRTSRMGCSLRVSFLATQYPQLGWTAGCLLITTRSGTPVSFLRKNHCFCHPTDGLETERRKCGSIPDPVQT